MSNHRKRPTKSVSHSAVSSSIIFIAIVYPTISIPSATLHAMWQKFVPSESDLLKYNMSKNCNISSVFLVSEIFKKP